MNENFLPFHPISISGIGDANTISSGPDNGANNQMRARFWQAMSHSTYQQVLSNVLSKFPNVANINIGGHGNEGFLTTGCGQTGQQDYLKNTMATWNRFYWGPVFQQLKPKNYSILSIYSCHTGAGESGADFLFLLAQATNHPCQARTGFTYANNQRLWFENNSVWQVATPNFRPDPISSPTPHLNNLDLHMYLEFDDQIQIITINDIKSIRLMKVGFIGTRSQNTIKIDISKLPDILSLIFGSTPFKIDGEPLAEITGIIELEVKIGKSVETRRFEIYNNRIAIDKKSKQSHYVNPALINFMNNQ